jgi:hypothetical protein
MEGPLTLTFSGITLTRVAGGLVSAALTDIAGVVEGGFLTIAGGGSDSSFDGFFLITGVASGTGTAGVVTWVQAATGAASTTGNISIQTSTSGQAQATVQDASGLAAGDVVNVVGAAPSDFNGPVTLASVLGNVATFPSVATGTATTPGTMTLIQDLPTTAQAVPGAILGILRDYAGNVTCQVPSLAGWGAGQIVSVPFSVFIGGQNGFADL